MKHMSGEVYGFIADYAAGFTLVAEQVALSRG